MNGEKESFTHRDIIERIDQQGDKLSARISRIEKLYYILVGGGVAVALMTGGSGLVRTVLAALGS